MYDFQDDSVNCSCFAKTIDARLVLVVLSSEVVSYVWRFVGPPTAFLRGGRVPSVSLPGPTGV